MHLIGCQDQKEQHLDAFYTEVTQWEEPVSREIGRVMLCLIARLRALRDERRVFGLTSRLRLCLLAEDTGSRLGMSSCPRWIAGITPWSILCRTLLLHGPRLMSGARLVPRTMRLGWF